MKKKGFTLIELLAVIVVLSVIALITVPMIMDVIEKTRKEAFKDSVLGAFTTIEYYLLENDLNEVPEEGIEVKNLELKNNPLKYGMITKNSEGKLEAVNVSDGRYCAQGIMEELNIDKGECDLTVPTCKLEIKGEKGINEWYGSKVTVEMETSEALTGGLQFGIGTEEKYDKSVEKGKKGKAEIEVEEKGKISCYVKNAGNKAGRNEIEVKIDKSAPTEANFSTTTTSNSIKVIASGKDEESDIVRYQFSKDGGTTWTKIQNENVYTFEGLKQQEYEIKVRVYNGTYVESKKENNLNKESESEKVSPSVITNPTITQESQTPSSGEYAQERVMKIIYHNTDITNPMYYFKSTTPVTVSSGVIEGSCGEGEKPSTCNNTPSTTLQANTWYKTNKETVSVTYQTNGELYAVTSDGLNISSATTASITNIDREEPKIEVSVEGKEATIKLTDNLALAGYQVTTEETESSNWETISGTSVSKTYIAEKAGTYYIHVKDEAGNTSYKDFIIEKRAFGSIVHYIVNNETYTETVNLGESVLEPKTFSPSKENAIFKGWSLSITSTDILSDKVADGNEITLYAVWQYSDEIVSSTSQSLSDPGWNVSGEYFNKTWYSNIDMSLYSGIRVTISANTSVNFRGGHWYISMNCGGASAQIMHPYCDWGSPQKCYSSSYNSTLTLMFTSNSGMTSLTSSVRNESSNGRGSITVSKIELIGRLAVDGNSDES